MEVCNKGIKIQRGLVRIARLEGEKYTFPDDPEAIVTGLREFGTRDRYFLVSPEAT